MICGILRAAIGRAAPQGMTGAGWEAAAQWAEEARLGSFLHASFSAAIGPDSEPARALERLRHRDAAAFLRRRPGIATLLGALVEAGAVPVAFKGLGVAFRYYESPDMRPIGDIDLIFRPEDMERASRAAGSAGFARASDDPAVLDYEDRESHHRTFVHADCGMFEAHRAMSRDIPDEARQEIVGGAGDGEILGVRVRFCSPGHLWVVLAAHMAASSPGNVWRWLVDLALISRHPSAAPDWPSAAAFCERYGLQIFASAAAATLRRHLDAGPPPEFSERMLAALDRRERSALAPVLERGISGLDGGRLAAARRLAGRPVREGTGILKYLWPHPGLVCIELGVRSDSP
ncbi:MAG: nucleotidyltransferase family protein, partial [Planctomycetota bacterium]|nr:nucleotidyltransferase family protein [Planctomycetota bacterium]